MRAGHEHPAEAGETCDLDNRRHPPTQPRFASPVSCRGEARARVLTSRGLGTAKETPALRLLFPAIPLPIPALEAPYAGALAGLVRQLAKPVRFAPCPRRPPCASGTGRATSTAARTSRPPRRRRRPHRAAGAARADLRLPEPSHRPARSIVRRRSPTRPASASAPSPRR